MQRPAEDPFIHAVPGAIELFPGDVPQGLRPGDDLAHDRGGLLAVPPADVVFGIHQIVLFHGVDDDEDVFPGERDGAAHGDAAEVAQYHRVFFSENRAELIEESRLEPQIAVFHGLTGPGEFGGIQLGISEFQQSQPRGRLQRGGAGHPRRKRHAALDGTVECGNGNVPLHQFQRHALDVPAAVPRRRRPGVGQIEGHLRIVPEIDDAAHASFHGNGRETGGLGHGAGEDDPLVVVCMIAQYLQPSRRAGRRRGIRPVPGPEFFDEFLHIQNTHFRLTVLFGKVSTKQPFCQAQKPLRRPKKINFGTPIPEEIRSGVLCHCFLLRNSDGAHP